MQFPGEPIGIIADDLTGACDTALQFYGEGGNTRILLDPSVAASGTSTQTWVGHTDSRHMTAFDAGAAARRAVHWFNGQLGLERFYKKMDSTLRGHIASECLAVLDELHWSAAVIAPAYPDEGRRTVGGYQLVRGLPVGQTETSRDPMFPIRESHLPTLLGQASSPELVGYVPLSKVMDGAGPILKALQEQIEAKKRLIVVDSCSDIDLEQLSLAINKMPTGMNVLPCGSAGLAKALSRKWLPHSERANAPAPIIDRTPLLVVIGTASGVTREQVRRLLTFREDVLPDSTVALFSMTPAQILGLEPSDTLVNQVVQALDGHNVVILTTSYPEETLAHTTALAEEQQLSRNDLSQRASQALGDAVRGVLSQTQAKLLLSGGETANVVCKAIGTRSLQIVGQLDTSIPLMIDDQARWIVTKSGAFGTPMGLLQICRNLQALETASDAVSI